MDDWQAGAPPKGLLALIESSRARFLICNLLKVEPAYAEAVQVAVDGWAVITELIDDEVATLNFNNSLQPEYIPLGASYRNVARRLVRPEVGQVLISYGGSDPQNVTGKTLRLLKTPFTNGFLPANTRVVAVLGPLFRNTSDVKAAVAGYPLTVDVVGPLSPGELAQVALNSDIAITTSGGTMYEFCSLGLPSVVVPILNKHEANARVLEERGAVVRTSIHHRLTETELTGAVARVSPLATRQAMAVQAQKEIDGMGAVRIAERVCAEWRLG